MLRMKYHIILTKRLQVRLVTVMIKQFCLLHYVGSSAFRLIFKLVASTNLQENDVTDTLTQIAWHGWAVAYIPPWGFLPIDLTYVGDFSDPLNAIKGGAVTFKETIQYMNVSQSDYIAETVKIKEFLEENNFKIFMEDHMSQTLILQKSFWEEITDVWPYLVAVVVVVGFSLSVVYFRRDRHKVKSD